MPELAAWCRESRVDLLIARCAASAIAAATAMEDAGGRLMDTLVYWERDLERRPFQAEPGERPVRPAVAGDRARLEEIARASFTGYFGHYHSDPRLDPAAATEGYVEWACTLLDRSSADSVVLLALQGGRPVGFGALAIREGRTCELVLNGIEPEAQGRGHYRGVLSGALDWASSAGCRRLFSSTAVSNHAVQKAWARRGLEPVRAEHTFHLWR